MFNQKVVNLCITSDSQATCITMEKMGKIGAKSKTFTYWNCMLPHYQNCILPKFCKTWCYIRILVRILDTFPPQEGCFNLTAFIAYFNSLFARYIMAAMLDLFSKISH